MSNEYYSIIIMKLLQKYAKYWKLRDGQITRADLGMTSLRVVQFATLFDVWRIGTESQHVVEKCGESVPIFAQMVCWVVLAAEGWVRLAYCVHLQSMRKCARTNLSGARNSWEGDTTIHWHGWPGWGGLLRSGHRLKRKIDYVPDPPSKSILVNQSARIETRESVIKGQIS